MKQDKWIVYFRGGGAVRINTTGIVSAVILACAERIKDGKHINAIAVECEDTGNSWPLGFVPITVNVNN